MTVPTINLNDGKTMPQLGFGVYQIPADETAEVVLHAIEAGYRSIDTASLYRNEDGVGQAIARADVPRDDLFVTTKVWNDEQGYDATIKACRNSLDRLKLDSVDLFLIHWPAPGQDLYVDTWRALITLRDEGLIQSIGVSNFEPAHLRRLIDETGEAPCVNQVELHPWLQQRPLREFCDEHSIVLEAWAPLAKSRMFEEPTLVAIAERLGRTPAQVVLRWHIQSGHVAIPKTVRPERMRENFDIFGFELSASDMDQIAALDQGHRIGPDPNQLGA
jgi:2,5-diketo-D-gluconate reductase A